MNISSVIRVGNNVELGQDVVQVDTTCHGFVTFRSVIPAALRGGDFFNIELDRRELREFLARTEPEFVTQEHYRASTPGDEKKE